MKRLVQLFLFCLLIIVCFYFYKTSFKQQTDNYANDKESLVIDNSVDQVSENNFIENLSYDVSLIGNKRYKIKAQESNISYQGGVEIVKMNFVIAEFFDEEKLLITITSNEATYETLNNNSRFKKNVKIVYLNHLIKAENVYINLKDNIIFIKDNVRYDGPLVIMKSDNIKIDLITKNINIFMDNESDNINVNTKN